MLSYWFSASVEYSIFQCLASCSCISTACLVWYSSLGDIIRTILPCSSPDLVSLSWPEVSVSMSPLGYWRNYLSVFGESYWWAWSVMTWPGSYPPYWGWICCDRSLLNPSIFSVREGRKISGCSEYLLEEVIMIIVELRRYYGCIHIEDKWNLSSTSWIGS